MKLVAVIALALTTSSAFAGIKEAWRNYSRPEIVSADFIRSLDLLPLSGRHGMERTGWSDDYWALNNGLINYRWNGNKRGFDLNSPSREKALRMSEDDIAELAATEKYDLYLGRYNYPLVSRVYGRSDKSADDWAGICHGWAPASLNVPEPGTAVMTNPDGIRIPFGASDIKALISFYYSDEVDAPTQQTGIRCSRKGWFGSVGCDEDLNAGAFHIIIANRLGIQKRGFIADVDNSKEVWNHPIMSYSSQIVKYKKPSGDAAWGTVREAVIRTTITYPLEVRPRFEPILGTPAQKNQSVTYEYNVELNSAGEIIGGDWKSDKRPDFLWFRNPTPFAGDFEALGVIYEESLKSI